MIDIFAKELLLQRREIVRVNRANDDARITEQVFGPHGEAARQFTRITDTLPVNLVFAGAQHGDELYGRIFTFSSADEFVFPARLALNIQNPGLRVAYKDR